MNLITAYEGLVWNFKEDSIIRKSKFLETIKKEF